MIANVNPVVADFDETWNTLRYSAVAKEIYTMSKVDTWRHGSRGAMNRDHQGGVGINAQGMCAFGALALWVGGLSGEGEVWRISPPSTHPVLRWWSQL